MTSKLDSIRLSDGSLPAFAWPGGYPLFYFTEAGACVCPQCANSAADDEAVEADVNYEDSTLFCDDCSTRIPPAYAEPE